MKWLTIKNVHGEGDERKAEIWIDGVIGFKDWFDDSGVVASEFVKTLDALGELAEIQVYINSPGGVVSDGVTITNYLINHKAVVSVTVMGQAASIASVIAQAADLGKLHMAIGTTMFVHDPLTIAMGDADDMREVAAWLDKIRDSILAIYRRRTDLSDIEIKQLMQDDTLMTAEEAVEWGFADSMDAELKAVASTADLQTAFKDAHEAFKHIHQTSDAVGHNHSGGHNMPPKDEPTVKLSEITAEYLQQNYAQLVESINNTAAEAERKRILAVKAQTIPGHEALIEQLMFDGKTTGAEAAVKIVQAENEKRGNVQGSIANDASKLNKVTSTTDAGTGDDGANLKNLPFEDRCEKEWELSAELRGEFSSYDRYLAFKQAEVGGNVRLLRK